MSTPVYTDIKLTSNFAVPQDSEGLVKQARSGVEAALSELYDRYFIKIYRFIFFRVGHKETAEDLSEDVFVKAFASLHTLENDAVFEGWLYQIARNKVIDYYRSKKALVPIEEVENTLEYETNIVDIVNLDFQQKTLIKFLKELTAEQQVVIKLKFFEDLTNQEISHILGKEEGAVRVIQHRAITKLKSLIDSISKLD
jgi:RNA polymerase sigma-70 factor, ECF subfamily